jgi:hypothetical protein
MDDPKKRGKQDRDRINVNEPHERKYWTDKLGCSEEELTATVDRVGPMAADVERELRRRT